MTAIVGILNKRAVAIAADSAVTVGSGDNTKIYNTSQKIFKISERNPVSMMIYGRANFMNAPWDVIIDMYRVERGDKTFKTVKEYAEDFLRYITECDYFTDAEAQKDYLIREMVCVYDKLKGAVDARSADDIAAIDNPTDEQISAIRQKHIQDVHKELADLCSDAGKAEGLQDFTFKQFSKHVGEHFDFLMKEVLEENWNEEEQAMWMHTYYNFLTSKFFYNESGLVFVGYGSKDIYPSLYSLTISGIFNDCLRWIEDHDEKITNDSTSYIQPYAQTDVMLTMMKGIAPAFYGEMLENHNSTLAKAKEQIVSALTEAGVPDDKVKLISEMEFDELNKEFEDKADTFMQDNYVQGVLDAVESFNVEDMANMAESLISITNLQRHFSSSEESVGGPVEVAVITRSGGFRWIKHRQW